MLRTRCSTAKLVCAKCICLTAVRRAIIAAVSVALRFTMPVMTEKVRASLRRGSTRMLRSGTWRREGPPMSCRNCPGSAKMLALKR
eukprot:3932680-Rhodomonas_salina.1